MINVFLKQFSRGRTEIEVATGEEKKNIKNL